MTFDDGAPCGAKFHWYVFSRKNLKHPKTELEWLLFDIYCKQVEQMHSKAMADRLEYLKSEEGLGMWLETRDEEIKRRIAEKEEKIVLGLIHEGLSIDAIARAIEIAPAKVEEIAQRHNIPLP